MPSSVAPYSLGVFTGPLASNKSPIVVCVGSRGDVFTESLPSNRYIHHNMYEVVINM
jgi:hypothetical protein